MRKARSAANNRASRKRNKQRKLDNNSKQIHQAIQWLLTPGIFGRLTFHGNTSWLAVELATLALLWIWSLYYERSFERTDPPSRKESD